MCYFASMDPHSFRLDLDSMSIKSLKELLATTEDEKTKLLVGRALKKRIVEQDFADSEVFEVNAKNRRSRDHTTPQVVQANFDPSQMLHRFNWADFAYVDSDDPAIIARFREAFEAVLDYIQVERNDPQEFRGSYLLRFTTWIKGETGKDVKERGQALIDNANNWANAALREKAAEVDNLNADTLIKLADAAGDGDFITHFRGFLAMRITPVDNGKPVMTFRPLTAKETLALELHPEILEDPRTILRSLADLIQLDGIQALEAGDQA